MGKTLAYAILGSGYWAGRMRTILAEDHLATCIEGARRHSDENLSAYRSRLSESLRTSGTQIAWICVPPGPHIPLMTEAALNAGLHVIVEKPWLNSRAETTRLMALALRSGLILGVHYQYCLLEAVETWRRDLRQGEGLEFRGRFMTGRSDRLGIDAVHNLGSHLMAIRNYAVPQAHIAEFTCRYEAPDERQVWVETNGGCVASINFLRNCEPIVQRFIERVENAINGAPFAFGVDFALTVAENTNPLKLKPTE
jgi:predicted dehydrogenase